MQRWLIAASTFIWFACLQAHAQTVVQGALGFSRTIVPGLNQQLDLSPGQRFYAEAWNKKTRQPAYQVSAPFESKMPGAMRLPFRFAIDATVLNFIGTRSDSCDYFAPEAGRFRAWHGMLGNVLAKGDTVGLRVCANGAAEWFVDNSNHNGMTTVWSRPTKKGDPTVQRITAERTEPAKAPVRQLDYLGVRDDAVIVRFTEISPDLPQRVDEYSFALQDDGAARGVVLEAQFEIRPDPSQRARVIVISPMGSAWASEVGSGER
jgi:hypothetical protein